MKQIIAKMKLDKKNKIYFETAGRRRTYMGANDTKMFSLDFLSGKMQFDGPKEKLP